MNEREEVLNNYLIIFKNPDKMTLDSEIVKAENATQAINKIKRKFASYYEPVLILNVVKLD